MARWRTEVNLYTVLGVGERATPREIRDAYLRRIVQVHPDRNPDPSAAAQAALINQAYDVLGDADQRAEYDAWLAAPGDDAGCGEDPSGRAEPAPPPSDRHLRVTSILLWGLVAAVPLLALSVLLVGALWPEVGATRGSPPDAPGQPPAGRPVRLRMVQERPDPRRPGPALVAGAVERLAAVVATRAPLAGEAGPGSAVPEVELDREQLDAGELHAIADTLEPLLEAAPEEGGPAAAAAYFNARLLALSVEVVTALRAGRPIDTAVDRVGELGRRAAVARWLAATGFEAGYRRLVDDLRETKDSYRPGASILELEGRLAERERDLAARHVQLSADQARGDDAARRRGVAGRDLALEQARAVLETLRGQAAAAERLDREFNRCLDARVLGYRVPTADPAVLEGGGE